MAKKKRVVRRVKQKAKTSRRNVKTKRIKRISPMKNRIFIVLNNLLLFIALGLISYVLTRFLTNEFFVNLFSVTAMVFGFVAVGFLITFVVLLILSTTRKKKRR